MIQVENLKKHYGPTQALTGVSFEVPRGEVLGFVGPNGAGKTTTMKILTGFLYPDEGSAKLGGLDVLEQPLEARKLVGYLPESNPLYMEMSVISYLRFAADIRGVEGRYRKAAVEKVVKDCGLEGVRGKDIGELSKGYKQRVGLAQAMIHDPDILILDEPTSGLDPNQIVEIRNLIKKIGQERTVILSTHYLQEVEATCDRVIIIHKGGIVADGKLEDLVSRDGDLPVL
ncbi:MAG TPA: ATP-binding cassette domain-containing protein, partial [Planctomycetes bacterium]|nr:ATP-binding cassette domain-containing protein [Planctomycetota bacterium]